jgi:ubiquinone/menaquinone biosynthesis C-methylase UbiE
MGTAKKNVEKDFLWLHLRDLPYFRAMLRAVEACFIQEIDLPSPVLDVGCGDGHFASLVFDRPVEVGLDPWAGPIRQAAKLGGYKSLVQADGGSMPFPDGYFRSAISNSVLEHIAHIDLVLQETARVLQPGAPFVFSVPNPGYLSELSVPTILRKVGLAGLGEHYREWFRQMSRVHHADQEDVWQERLDKAGFSLERSWRYFSPAAMRALEWGHYFGAPTLLVRWLTGRWILVPARWNLALTERLVRPHSQPEAHPQGTFTFFISQRR